MSIYVLTLLYIIFIIVINIVWNDTYQKMNNQWGSCYIELIKKNNEVADMIKDSWRDIADTYRIEILEINERLENLENKLDMEKDNEA